VFGVRFPGLTPELVDLQYFGEMAGIPPYSAEARPTDESPVHTGRLTEALGWIFSRDDLPELREDRAQVGRLVAARPALGRLGLQEVVDYGRSFQPLLRRLFARHIVMSAVAGIGIATVAQVCEAIGQPQLAITLVAGVGDVDSAAPSWAMWEMSRAVNASPALTAAFDQGVPGVLDRIETAAATGDTAAVAWLAGWAAFLEQFGCRGPNEWELRSDTWGTRPALPLAAIDRMRLAPDDESPQARTEVRVAARDEGTTAVRGALAEAPEALGQFEAGLRAALLFNAGRERTKTNCIKLVHEQRLAALELGRRLVEAGQLDEPRHVFMLVDDELDDLVDTTFGRSMWAKPDMAAVARDREAYYLGLFEVEPPFVTQGAPPPPSEWPRRSTTGTLAQVGTALAGIAGSPGLARGRARVVLDPGDPRGLLPGEVLVAPITDPAWTPLFVPAAAVVVDVGAQISHAVIVSRELGLPCVVSVTGATRTIPDGALVEVNGDAGTVTILELAEA
jgi:pyruvate,water dikinase